MKLWIKAKKWLHKSQVSGFLGSVFQKVNAGSPGGWQCSLMLSTEVRWLPVSFTCLCATFPNKNAFKDRTIAWWIFSCLPPGMVCKSLFRAYTGSGIAGQMQSSCLQDGAGWFTKVAASVYTPTKQCLTHYQQIMSSTNISCQTHFSAPRNTERYLVIV